MSDPTGRELDATLDSTLGSRVLREAIRTPVFREILRLHVESGSPEGARALVRTFLAEDVSLSLGFAAGAGKKAEHAAAALAQVGRELDRNPPEMLGAFLSSIAAGADASAFREVGEAWAPVVAKIAAMPAIRADASAAAVGDAVGAAFRGAGRAVEANPQAVAEALSRVHLRDALRLGWLLVKAAVRGRRMRKD